MLDVIKNRRSVRKFKDEEIKKEHLLDLVEAGFMAPSARAQQSSAFVIVDDKEVLNKLKEVSPGARVLEGAKAAIVVFCKDVDKLLTKEMVLEDLGATTQNILLEATSLGIGSCWIGIAPLADRMEKAKEILNIKNGFVFSIIALGYPLEADAFYQKDKIKKELIYWNKVE